MTPVIWIIILALIGGVALGWAIWGAKPTWIDGECPDCLARHRMTRASDAAARRQSR